VGSTASSFAIWLAFLFPGAQLIRMLDGLVAAIDPQLSVVGTLHDLFAANAGGLVATIAAVGVTVWLLRRVRSGSRVTIAALAG